VSFLIAVRNSAANCGSLFWINEFGNQVYASTVLPTLLKVYGAVYCEVAVQPGGQEFRPSSALDSQGRKDSENYDRAE